MFLLFSMKIKADAPPVDVHPNEQLPWPFLHPATLQAPAPKVRAAPFPAWLDSQRCQPCRTRLQCTGQDCSSGYAPPESFSPA